MYETELFLEVACAVRALCSVDVDFCAAVGALLCCSLFLCYLFLLLEVAELVDTLNHQEDDECHDKEVENCGDEVTESDGANVENRCHLFDCLSACDFADDELDAGHNNVVAKRFYDCAESSADDNADCEIHYIALTDEFFEFSHKLFHC